MVDVRQLEARDVDAVVERVRARLAEDARLNRFVDARFSTDEFADALHSCVSATWVAVEGDAVLGHLYGALLESDDHGHGAWVGPDGASFDDPDVLADLYSVAGASWIAAGATEHYVWVLDTATTTDPWLELGFARMHRRGVLALEDHEPRALGRGYVARRGSLADLDTALTMLGHLDRAQEAGPSFSLGLSHASARDDLTESLEDPDVRYYLVEFQGEVVAQCLTFALPERRGSFPATVHLSAVVVSPTHRGQGVATAMVDAAFEDARREGFSYAETNWRVTNRRAARHWVHYGFTPTYVRLHRTIGRG